jgi:hypothetical protein
MAEAAVAPINREPPEDYMLHKAFEAMKATQPCTPENKPAHDAVIYAVDSLGAYVVGRLDRVGKGIDRLESGQNDIRLTMTNIRELVMSPPLDSANQDAAATRLEETVNKAAQIVAQAAVAADGVAARAKEAADDKASDSVHVDIDIPNSAWAKLKVLPWKTIAAIILAALTAGGGGLVGVRAFFNSGRATMDKQVESHTMTGDENAAILASVKQLLAEDRKANAAAEEERTARIVAAAIERAKVDAQKWQAEKLAAEKAGRKDGR